MEPPMKLQSMLRTPARVTSSSSSPRDLHDRSIEVRPVNGGCTEGDSCWLALSRGECLDGAAVQPDEHDGAGPDVGPINARAVDGYSRRLEAGCEHLRYTATS